jgi:hypothetical protein
MNPDPVLASDPLFVLLAWAAGVALAGAAVTIRALVGPGFTWLASATAVLIGVWAALGGEAVAVAAVAATAAGGVSVAWNRTLSGLLMAVGAALFAIQAMEFGGPVLTVTAVMALGGITAEMLLGHWYLVDPTLSRLVLRILAVAGVIGIVLDSVMVAILLDGPSTGLGMAIFWVLAATTLGLMLAVLGALRYPAYSGVMAATGLSYLAVLTGLAVVFMGRVMAAGGGPF